MPLDAAMLESDLGGILADFPQSVTFVRGARRFTAPCAVSSTGGGASVGEGAAGLDIDSATTVTVRPSDCKFAVRRGDKALLSGERLRVAAIRRVPGDAALEIELGGA